MASLSVRIDSINSANVQKEQTIRRNPWVLHTATERRRKKWRHIFHPRIPTTDTNAAESDRDSRQKRPQARWRSVFNGQAKLAASLQVELDG